MTSALQQLEVTGEKTGGTMLCPKCGGGVRCVDSRSGPNNSIRRRRRCTARACGHRFTTFEIMFDKAPALTPEAIAHLVDLVEASLAPALGAIARVRGVLDAAKLLRDLQP